MKYKTRVCFNYQNWLIERVFSSLLTQKSAEKLQTLFACNIWIGILETIKMCILNKWEKYSKTEQQKVVESFSKAMYLNSKTINIDGTSCCTWLPLAYD